MSDTRASRARRRRDAGFTLVEMMVALAVFSFGMLGVTAMFATSIRANAYGKHMTEATSLAQSRLDRLLTAEDYDNLETFAGTETSLNANGDVSGVMGLYTRETVITSPITGMDIKQIKVTVSWRSHAFTPSPGGSTTMFARHVTLTTLRAKD